MSRRSVYGCVLLMTSLVGWHGVLSAADLVPTARDDIHQLLATHCFACHGSVRPKGGINLEALHGRGLAAETLRTWRSAGSLVKQELMPPEETEHPLSDIDRERLVRWIDALRYDGPPDPGRVTLRRLNRREYAHTIRDLLGVELPVADLLPRDEIGNGFDTSADVLALPPALFDKYVEAALLAVESAIEVGAIATTITADRFTVTAAGETLKPTLADGVLTLTQGGECSTIIYAPIAGRYRLRVNLGGVQAGREPVRVQVMLDGQPLKDQRVASPKPRTTSLGSVDLEAGQHRLSLIFLNPERVDGPKGVVDRSLLLGELLLEGPPARRPSPPHLALMGDDPAQDADPRVEARAVLARFLPRAWRRPVEPSEIDRLMPLFDQALALGETWSGALRHPLQAALMSPHFLFRIERDRPTDGITTLNGHELANRLSYFLWSSMPDDALFAAAAKGDLATPEGRAVQVRRMLADAKSRALVEGFASQWLTLGNLDDFEPDPGQFRGFDARLRESMLMEPLEFFATIMAEDRDVAEFVASDWTVLDPRLAAHYDIPFTGSTRQKVSTVGTGRGGVLTMAAVLAVTSNADHTNPPRRGKFVLEQMLDDPPPPPPPTAGGLPPAEKGAQRVTVRQRLEAHRTNPECASCHKRLDPLGFAFEGYDLVGRARDADGGQPIDTSGILPGGEQIRGPEDLKRVLTTTRRGDFLRCLAGKMLTYAISRGLDHRDEARIDAIATELDANGRRFSTLILAVVESPQFLQRSARMP